MNSKYLHYGDKLWVRVKNDKGEYVICKREFCYYQDDGSLVIRAYDTEFFNRHEPQDCGKTWAFNKEDLERGAKQ